MLDVNSLLFQMPALPSSGGSTSPEGIGTIAGTPSFSEHCLESLHTVRLGKMAQHAQLWALFMAKLKCESQNASNMALGKFIVLQHIKKSAS